jgi:hypothetical protein
MRRETGHGVRCLDMNFYLTGISAIYVISSSKWLFAKLLSKYFHLTIDFFVVGSTIQTRQCVTMYPVLVPVLIFRVC